MRPLVYTGLLLVAALLGGCTTWVDVQNVAKHPKAHGIRYSLPATFLLVQPQADGTASYSWIYLPDSDLTYAIDQHAVLSKFTLDVTLANGLLGKVNAQSDDTAVPAKFMDAAQASYAARVTAATNAKKDLTTAHTALIAAQLAQIQAQQEYNAITAAGSGFTDDEKRQAQLKLIDANAALQQAQTTYSALPGAGAADLPPGQSQWGPILFRVDQSGGTVKLIAVNDQAQYETVTAASAAGAAAGGAYTLTLQGPNPMPAATPLMFTVAISTAISAPDPATTSVVAADGSIVTQKPTITPSADKKSLVFSFANGLPKGTYTLTPGLVLTAGQNAVGAQSVTFTVQ